MNTFRDTVPVKRPVEITPDEAHNIIRGWPESAHRTHDYAVHTAECDECEDHDVNWPRSSLPSTASLLVMLAGFAMASVTLRAWMVAAAACVAAVVLVVLS